MIPIPISVPFISKLLDMLAISFLNNLLYKMVLTTKNDTNNIILIIKFPPFSYYINYFKFIKTIFGKICIFPYPGLFFPYVYRNFLIEKAQAFQILC